VGVEVMGRIIVEIKIRKKSPVDNWGSMLDP
jgi:hypothetical protein